MTRRDRRTVVLPLAALVLTLNGGCGCEMYNAKATAEGKGYLVADPDQTTSIKMESRGSGPFDSRILDAAPSPGLAGYICLSTERYQDPDIYLTFDYSLELGVLQSGTQAPSPLGCNGVASAIDPEHPTLVYGSIEFEGKEVELDTIEARSTSLKPPRYDVKLGGKDAEGKAYEFDLHVKIDRAGNAVFCD